MTEVNLKLEIRKFSRRRSRSQTTQDLSISRCRFAEDGKETYKD